MSLASTIHLLDRVFDFFAIFRKSLAPECLDRLMIRDLFVLVLGRPLPHLFSREHGGRLKSTIESSISQVPHRLAKQAEQGRLKPDSHIFGTGLEILERLKHIVLRDLQFCR